MEDRTNYFETLPSNRLNLGLWLEADRMRSLAVNQTNFENQRQTVKEERRLGVDNQPYAQGVPGRADGAVRLHGLLRLRAHRHRGHGRPRLGQGRGRAGFFNQYYAPNNAVLTVVGDFDPAEARRLIQQYYGDIPRVPAPPAGHVRLSVRHGRQAASR